jgi:hypothetical protein
MPEIARVRGLSVAEFVESFERPGTPVILEEDLSWPAFRRWTRAYLLEKLGDRPLRIADQFGRMSLAPFATFVRYLEDPAKRQILYLKDVELTAHPDLQHDYAPPPYFATAEVQPGAWRWLYLGPASSGTPLHTDIDRSAAWNVVISGRKEWWFFRDNGEVLHGATGPGEVMFTPCNYRHAAVNQVETLALTHNYFRDDAMIAQAWRAPTGEEPRSEEVRQRLMRLGITWGTASVGTS